jgi:hypothetical protein
MQRRLYFSFALILGAFQSLATSASSEIHNPLARLCQEALLWTKAAGAEKPPLHARTRTLWDQVFYTDSDAQRNNAANWYRLTRVLRRQGVQVNTRKNPFAFRVFFGSYGTEVVPSIDSPCSLNRIAGLLDKGLDCSVRFLSHRTLPTEPHELDRLKRDVGEFQSVSGLRAIALRAGSYPNLELVVFHEGIHAYLEEKDLTEGESLLSGSWSGGEQVPYSDLAYADYIDFSEIAAWSGDIYLQILAYANSRDENTRLHIKGTVIAELGAYMSSILGPLEYQLALALDFLKTQAYRPRAETLNVRASWRRFGKNDTAKGRSPFVLLESTIRYNKKDEMRSLFSMPRSAFPKISERSWMDTSGNGFFRSSSYPITNAKEKRNLVEQIASYRVDRFSQLQALTQELLIAAGDLFIRLWDMEGAGTEEDQKEIKKLAKTMHSLVTKAMQERNPFWKRLQESQTD